MSGGMKLREIQGSLLEQYATEVSPNFSSSVTDEVMAEATAWQARPLEPIYPVVLFDALRVKSARMRSCATRPSTWPWRCFPT